MKNAPEGPPGTESNRISQLRKIYQKLLLNSIENLDIIWKEYELFEITISQHLADKILPEYYDKYLHSKSIYNEKIKYTININYSYIISKSNIRHRY
jgi:hypothetical protein